MRSRLPTDRFVFEGFLPARKGRQKRLGQIKDEVRTLVFYESSHRILKTLRDLFECLGDRPAAVARELTKKFEQVVRGTLGQLSSSENAFQTRGEFVIVVNGNVK